MQDPDLERLTDAYRTWGPRLLAYAVAVCGQRAWAEEALQGLFSKLSERPSLLAGARDPGAYLFLSLRRHAQEVRKRERRWFRTLSESPRDFLQPAANRGLPDEECREIESAVGSLPAEHREVVMLRVWAGLGWPQIAEVTGENARTLESRYRAALETLKSRLGGLRERA